MLIASVALTRTSNTIFFKDGIDDFAYLNIDGQTVIDDNTWTGYDGTQNGGSPISTLDVSDARFDDGEWVSFEMISWEGGGGDAGVLYWDQNAAGRFPATNTDAASTDAVVPAANFRSDIIGATTTLMAMGFTQIGDESTAGDFGLILGPGEWDVTVTAENTGASALAEAALVGVPEPSAFALIGLASLGPPAPPAQVTEVRLRTTKSLDRRSSAPAVFFCLRIPAILPSIHVPPP